MVKNFAHEGLILQLMAVDPATRHLRSITVWESEAIMRKHEARRDVAEFARNFERFYESSVVWTYFEVRAGYLDLGAWMKVSPPDLRQDIWFQVPAEHISS